MSSKEAAIGLKLCTQTSYTKTMDTPTLPMTLCTPLHPYIHRVPAIRQEQSPLPSLDYSASLS